jgi:hypothetical protein
MRAIAALGCATVVMACGGGGGPTQGTATFTGSIAGQAVAAADAMSAVVQGTTTRGQTFRNAVVVITSAQAICSKFTGKKEPHGTQYLLISLGDFSSGSGVADAPKGPGTFPIGVVQGQTTAALGTFFATDSSCNQIDQTISDATSGSITLTSVGGTYAGSFNLTMQSKNSTDVVSGTFSAPACAGLTDLIQSGASTTCE